MPEEAAELLDRTVRLNPQYQMIRLRSARGPVREIARRLSADRDLYGLLLSDAAEQLPAKAIGRDVWDLLSALQSPRSARIDGVDTSPEYAQFLKKQIIDGVIEVATDSGFKSGINAVDGLGKLLAVSQPVNEIQRLSWRAIELAYRSAIGEVNQLACRLYFYNRLPVSRHWLTRFPNESHILRFLQLERDGSWPGMPAAIRAGTPKPSSKDRILFHRYWRSWIVRASRRIKPAKSQVFKVYLSPVPDGMAKVLHIALDLLPGSGAFHMKAPRTVQGILRPDKIIAYFTDRRDAEAFGRQVLEKSPSVEAQGVPFTSAIDAGALASWGVEPPASAQAFAWQERNSWRFWVALRIARAILNVRKAQAKDPVHSILSAVEVSGIDTRRWLPTSQHWDFSR